MNDNDISPHRLALTRSTPPPQAGEEKLGAASRFPPPFTGEVLAKRAEGGAVDRQIAAQLITHAAAL